MKRNYYRGFPVGFEEKTLDHPVNPCKHLQCTLRICISNSAKLLCRSCHLDRSSNFELLIYFFVFCWIEKKDKLLCNVCNETFSRSWRSPKLHFTTTLKKTQQQKCLINNNNFNIRWPVHTACIGILMTKDQALVLIIISYLKE